MAYPAMEQLGILALIAIENLLYRPICILNPGFSFGQQGSFMSVIGQNLSAEFLAKVILTAVKQAQKIIIRVTDHKISKIDDANQPYPSKNHIVRTETVVHQTLRVIKKKAGAVYPGVNLFL